MRLQRTGPRMCGSLGPVDPARLERMAGGLPTVLRTDGVSMCADGAVPWPSDTGASWSPRPLPERAGGSLTGAARRHDAVSVAHEPEGPALQAGISGAVPIYVDEADDGVYFSSALAPLARTRQALRPDWDGWAHVLAAGAPLDGRTVISGIRRLRPWERITIDAGHTKRSGAEQWPWLQLTPGRGASITAVQAALDAAVRETGGHTPLAPMLSGGWDSRILPALAARHQREPTVMARTTSSDTGTVMEELIAAKAAEGLGVRHRVLMPRRDQFGDDLTRFAEAVDFQTSFHIWFVPVQRDLNRAAGTALDGLGGGLFLGGAFADPPGEAPVLDRRLHRMTHYLTAAKDVLQPRALSALRDRTRAAFEAVAAPLLDHPFASTFTAYLNRTVPGISLAPYGLLASATTVATPFVDDRLVTASLKFPPAQHAEGRLNPDVLRHFSDGLANQPTAEELVPWPRPHPRRIASPQAAAQLRALVLAEPVRPLVADALARAGLDTWVRLLSTTGSQHLLRGLAVMSAWFSEYGGLIEGDGVEVLCR